MLQLTNFGDGRGGGGGGDNLPSRTVPGSTFRCRGCAGRRSGSSLRMHGTCLVVGANGPYIVVMHKRHTSLALSQSLQSTKRSDGASRLPRQVASIRKLRKDILQEAASYTPELTSYLLLGRLAVSRRSVPINSM